MVTPHNDGQRPDVDFCQQPAYTIPSQYFDKKRGLATGIASSGGALGGAFWSLVSRDRPCDPRTGVSFSSRRGGVSGSRKTHRKLGACLGISVPSVDDVRDRNGESKRLLSFQRGTSVLMSND
jgi:hypothetical protein